MSIDKSYLELALDNIQDGQCKEEVVLLVNEALKQAATDTDGVRKNSNLQRLQLPITNVNFIKS